MAALALAVSGLAAVQAAAQETREPRAPALGLRPNPTPEGLATLPADTFLVFDPWTGGIVGRSPIPVRFGERYPRIASEGLEAYLGAERESRRSRLWSATVADRLSGRKREEEGLIPEFENPLKIPEPLAKVFGEGSQFDIQGRLHLAALGSKSTQDPDLRSEILRRAVGGIDLNLDQILDLKVIGTVGTKLDVAVDFNSARELNSKQLLSASYTGTEDEILKKVEVGDINVLLPPSRFLGASAARGTFGAQAVAQLGPVDLRVLGSRKEGQSTERSLSIAPRGEGVLQQVTLDIKDTQFQDDRFFLLFHPDSLASPRLAYPNSGTALANPASTPETGSLNVWLDDGNPTNNREKASKQGTAFVNPTTPEELPGEAHQGFFDLLVEGEDYVVTDGIVLEMKRQLNDDEVLAVSYVTQGGTQVGSPQEAEEVQLKLVKPINPDTLNFTWDYTLRNVYSLREPNIQLGSLSLSVYRGNQDLKQTFENVNGTSTKYSAIFGVTDENQRVNVPRLLRDPFGGPDLLVFPDVRPFFRPTDPNGAPIPIQVPNRKLYFNNDARTALDNQIYFIEASYLSRGGLTGEVELGAANVIEGSEDISIGGETLVRGRDYQIFYDFGKVVFNDPSGLSDRHPNDPIRISFEVAPLFNLAPTSLWGASGTWNLSSNAIINSTVLMQRQGSLANRPILGAEPTQTTIAEVNGIYQRDLDPVARWLDRVPGLRLDTSENSDVTFRGEMAFSLPNPNTEGEVFLNDFENVDVAKQISAFFRAWRLGGVPSQTDLSLARLAQARWFTFSIDSRTITPNAIGADKLENLFDIKLEPVGETPADRRDSWRSIQTVLSTTGEDLSRQEFLEFFVSGETGTMIVDLGTVDEDAARTDKNGALVGIGLLDTEERNPNTRDNNLDVGEDTGIDGVAGSDLLNVPGDDGNDDFSQVSGPGSFPLNPNGTENNTTLDTEDDNLNGILDRQENLGRWVVDLGDPKYEVPGSRSNRGFRQIRLPLARPDETLGTPDLRNVRVLRVAFTGVERETDFQIARPEIVGSTFLKRGIVAADGTVLAGSNSDSLQITSINDVENPEYRSPPGVRAQTERADQVAGVTGVAQEQSLELIYDGVPSGARGAIFRPLFDRESYIDYDRMQVWVQGRRTTGGPQPRFFVAFGLDTLNVYEYSAPLKDEEWEEHVIDFSTFTELKRALLDSLDALGPAAPRVGEAVSPDGLYRVKIQTAAAPPPTLTEVSQLTIGVENDGLAPVSGRFWIDEWRLNGPVRQGDAAQYVNARATLADFAQFNVAYDSRGGRYRDLGATRNNFDRSSTTVNAIFNLDRFLPESWGVAFPLTWDHYGNDDAPLFRVGSDILLQTDTERRVESRINDRDIVTLRLFRSRQSSNPLIAATLDQLEGRLSYTSEGFRAVDLTNGRTRWETYLGYHNAFRKRALPLPLDWIAHLPLPAAIKSSPLIARLAGADFNWVPANLDFSAQTAFEDRGQIKRLASERDRTADSTRTVQGTARISFQPFSSMRASIGVDNTRDLNFPETVVQRGFLGVDALRNQTLDFNWTPPVAAWLTPRYSYTTSYIRNHSREASRSLDTLDLRDYSVTNNQTLTFDVSIPDFVATFVGGPPTTTQERPWWRETFQPIRIDRSRQENTSFVQQETDPGFGFTLGFGDLGHVDGSQAQSRTENDAWGLSGGFNLLYGVQLRSGYRRTTSDRRYFAGTNEQNTRIFPDVDLRWTSARAPAMLTRYLAGIVVTSNFERRLGDNASNGQPLGNSDQRTWDPLVAFTLNWTNGMTTDLRASTSQSFSGTIRGGELDNRREETSTDLVLNFNYSIRPGSKIYVPFPTLWGVTLQHPLVTKMSVSRRYREDATTLTGEQEPALNEKTLTTEVRPSVQYEFGRVASGFAFSWLSRKDQKRDITNKTLSLEAFLDFLF